MKDRFVFVDPPSPPGFVSFKHSHGGYGEFCRESRLRIPTLDVFHGASLLLDHGFQAEIVDSVLEGHDLSQSADEIVRRKPSVVVIRTAGASLPHDLELARNLRKRCGAKIVIYGPQLSTESERALARQASDAVVAGDAPAAFLEIARGKALKEASSVPIPRWELVDYKRYTYVTSQTSWGCPLGCGYCSYPVTQGARWKTRSIESVVREFSALRDRYQLRYVQLRDPEFTFNRRRTADLCEALIEAGVPITWGCDTRLDTLDEELIELMAKAGCLRVTFGVESLNPESLRLMNRPVFSPAVIRAKTACLKKNGMLAYALYIIGLPGETRKSTRELIDFALDLGTEAASFSMATPFPGTALERLGRARGWISAPESGRLTSSVPSMCNEDLSAGEIEELYLEAKRRWKQRKQPAFA